MQAKFSTSTNIIRDKNVEIDYIVTPNATNIASQLISDFQAGQHSFSIIGSYGTGKSSFIWALENNLIRRREFFFRLNGQFGTKSNFEFINIVGSYTPLTELLQKEVNAPDSSPISVLKYLDKKYKKVHAQQKLLIIVIDEFGKLLEFAGANNPEDSMYFIQQLAEFCNDSERDIILLTTLHQNFGAYADHLNYNQKQEWIKVKGRFKEITFNEPVEQLLFLASKRIKSWGEEKAIDLSQATLTYKLGNDYYLLPYGLKSKPELAEELFPLDIIAAAILTKALQRYGQNERSLFTFLNDRNESSLFEYFKQNKAFTLVNVFDFIYNNFFSFLITTLNEDKNNWDALRTALSRTRSLFKEDYSIGEAIIKVIGMLNILGEPGGHVSDDFITNYLAFSGFKKKLIKDGIKKLSNNKIIYFRNFANRYVLTEGTDLDYEAAINKAAEKINPDLELITALKEYFIPGVENPRRISLQTGTSRFFEYVLSQRPIDMPPTAEIDGYINIVISEEFNEKDVRLASQDCADAIVYIYFPDIKIVKNIILEIEKIRIVIKENLHDKVAERELKIREENEIRRLNKVFNNALFESTNKIKWYYAGEELKIRNKKDLNIKLSDICGEVYKNTPVLKNELFNKHKYSSQISTARKKYLYQLLNCGNEKLIGLSESKYPPEKSIYLSILQKTGIHRLGENKEYYFGEPTDDQFKPLWEVSNQFLQQAKLQKISLQEFVDILSGRPFKLKQGFIDFWIPTFLVIKSDEYALFNELNYVPFLSSDLMDLIWKNPEKFFIKAYNVEGVKLDLFNKYRDLINLKGKDSIDQKAFLNTIRPFLIFYRELPDYSKSTKNISAAAVALRSAIAKSPDPETAFYNDFPIALGYQPDELLSNAVKLDNYILNLQKAIREIRSSYDELLSRFEEQIKLTCDIKADNYQKLKEHLINRLENLDINKLADSPKKLLSRIRTPYEKRTDFLNSLSFLLLDKSLEDIQDNEEPLLYESFKNQYFSLEKAVPIQELNKGRASMKVISLDITEPDGSRVQKFVNLSSDGKTGKIYKSDLINKYKDMAQKYSNEERIEIFYKLLMEELENES